MSKIIPLLVSIAALILSTISLWRSHFAKFKPIIVCGDLFFQIFPIMNSKQKWFLPSAIATISIANEGARPGVVYGVRLVATYPTKPDINHHDILDAVFELDVSESAIIGKDRFTWFKDHKTTSWVPVIVPSGGTVTKRLVFETRWDNPIAPDEMRFSLEILINRKNKWEKADEWKIPLKIKDWAFYTDKKGGANFASKMQLVTRTSRSKKDFPQELIYNGEIPPSWRDGVEPSFLDYEKHK